MAAEKVVTEIRREQIVEAALQVLGSRGIQQLNVAEIAQRVGLVPSAIYRHFKGKDEILDAVVELIGQRLPANVDAVRREFRGSLDRLEHLLQRHVRLILNNQAIPRIMMSDEMAAGDPERKSRIYHTIRAYLESVGQIVREGQEAGEIRADTDPETIAMLFVGIVQPGALLWHLGNGQFDIQHHAVRAWRLFRDAIAES